MIYRVNTNTNTKNELLSVNTLHECVVGLKEVSSLLFQCIISILWELIILFKEESLQFTICAYHPWEMMLNISLDASFHNVYNCKGIQEKAGVSW